MANISFHTTNPRDIKNIFDNTYYEPSKITIYSIDNKTLVLNSESNFKKKFVQTYDVALLTLELAIKPNIEGIDIDSEPITKHLLLENLILMLGETEFLFLVNGKYDVIPDTTVVETLQNTNTKELTKAETIQKIENELALSSNFSVLRAYNKLSDYFSAEKYSFNNNVFKLLEHKGEALKIAKKVLLKNLAVNEISK